MVDSGKPGFIPKDHLSDSLELCETLYQNLKVGDPIEKAMYWNKMKIAVSFCYTAAAAGNPLPWLFPIEWGYISAE